MKIESDKQEISKPTRTVSSSDLWAEHLVGGNLYDDVRVDIDAAHKTLDTLPQSPLGNETAIYKNPFVARLKYYITALLQKAGILETLCLLGLRRKWLNEFTEYWGSCLGCRPIQGMDFYALYHEYRKKQQRPDKLAWESQEQHIRNWQDPAHLFSVFYYVRAEASKPIAPMHVWKFLPRRGRFLEYGCSLAPFYSNSRSFLLRPKVEWTLADIPTFAFHYAKYRYRGDINLNFFTVRDFADPLPNSDLFDAVFLTTVLEHVDDPVSVVNYLFGKMRPGGILVFDFIKSDGTGLDTPSALIGRDDCLGLIAARTKILSGSFTNEGHQPLMVVRFVG